METIDFIQRHMNEVLNECEKGSERHSAVKLAMVILQAEAKECEAIRYGTKISQLRKKWNRLSVYKKVGQTNIANNDCIKLYRSTFGCTSLYGVHAVIKI